MSNNVTYVGGGTDLMPLLKFGVRDDKDIVFVKDLGVSSAIETEGDAIVIGAAATLIYREWRTYGKEGRMSPATARLLIAAILDNTLNLTSSNTTEEDRETFAALRRLAGDPGSVHDG